MQEETKLDLDCFQTEPKKYKVRDGVRTKKDKSNQREVVFFWKAKKESKTGSNQIKGFLIFSGASVAQIYKKKNARA